MRSVGAAAKAPERWSRVVVMNIPPFAIFGENIPTYDQIKRSFYFWYFQMQHVAADVIAADDFAFIDRIWGDWSPGYDASEDLPRVKDCIRDPRHFRAALGYYTCQFDPARFFSPEWVAEQADAWGADITQPTLYLHGTEDGCHKVTQEQVDRVPSLCGPGSHSELIEGVGHFLMVQRPTEINKRVLEFLHAGA
ncbi:MAG TPA: alpha/beta hydrolase [Pseudonocardia sp.]|nr:alpha/beta hydrolase [Pseudonocardia sp.]